MKGYFTRERDFRRYRRLGFPRPLPWGWWRYAGPATKRRYWRLSLRILVPLGLMLVAGSLLPLFSVQSTANFVVGIIATLFLIATLVMSLRSIREISRVSEQIHAEVRAKKSKP